MIKMNFNINSNEFYFIPRYLEFKYLKLIFLIEMTGTCRCV